MSVDRLERFIYNTIRYFDIFDMPVTATQIWRCLIINEPGARIRWGGQALPTLRQVQQALASGWLSDQVGSRWGHYFLKGKDQLVHRRLRRHVLAQHKWQIARRVARWLAAMPFVRMIAGSGSLALDNTRPSSDLDLMLIVAGGRIWTARFFVLLAAQLTGRRRKYWNRLAPDRACLNHYLTDDRLAVDSTIRNLYTAVAYTHLVPLFGRRVLAQFQRTNAAWMKGWLMYADAPVLAHRYQVILHPVVAAIKSVVEQILLEPVGQLVERLAQRLQQRAIARHTVPGRSGRVAISSQELAFHPDSQVPSVLAAFAQDPGQGQLL